MSSTPFKYDPLFQSGVGAGGSVFENINNSQPHTNIKKKKQASSSHPPPL